MGTELACTLLPWGLGRGVVPSGTSWLLHMKLSGAPRCPPWPCEDQACSLCKVAAVCLAPGGVLGPVCVHGEDRG